MVTRVTTNQTQQPLPFCDFCHQKPKFSNHQFCSKTCASQASLTLCKHCHKKPKFQNFDYCGKNCAALANASAPKFQAVATNMPQQLQAPPQKAAANNAKANPSKSFNPVHIAKQAFSSVTSTAPPTQPAGQTVPGTTAQMAAQSNNPFLSYSNAQQPPQQVVVNGVPQPLNAPAPPLPCLIPGCGKPVHVDAQWSSTSDYCSRKHREEAVAMGLASPCIMCQTMPQSDTDYFCGKACRDEAFSKV